MGQALTEQNERREMGKNERYLTETGMRDPTAAGGPRPQERKRSPLRADPAAVIMEETKQMMRQRSVEGISVKGICSSCGISRQTFYKYFRDKYDLVAQIYRKMVTGIMSVGDGKEPWQQTLGRIFWDIRNEGNLFLNALKYKGQNSLEEGILKYVYNIYVKRITEKRGAEPDAELLFAIRFHVCGGVGTMLDWIYRGMKEDPHLLAESICGCMPEQIREYFQ